MYSGSAQLSSARALPGACTVFATIEREKKEIQRVEWNEMKLIDECPDVTWVVICMLM